MMTAVSRHAAEDEWKFQSKEQLEEVGDMPATEMVATKLP
jgi:hypothetical protein